jgi:hypothetical protein
MSNRLIMRSVYLRESEDAELRQIAYEINRTKSDLIRAAITNNLETWRKLNDPGAIAEHIDALDKAVENNDDGVYEYEFTVAETARKPASRRPRKAASDSQSRRKDSPSNAAVKETAAAP